MALAEATMNLVHALRRTVKSPSNLRGGLRIPRHKPGLASDGIIPLLTTPEILRIPLLNYYGEQLSPLVSIGQHINTGDAIAAGIIASCSGTVAAIGPESIGHPSGRPALCVTVKTDTTEPELRAIYKEEAVVSAERVDACAIYGLGGAGFNTSEKLVFKTEKQRTIQTLVINAVECEPMISCDESLILSSAHDVIDAVSKLVLMTGCEHCIFAIEDDKTQAIDLITKALASTGRGAQIELKLLPAIYPAGAEKPLVERLTGIHIPGNHVPGHYGILCLNVATVYAIEQARKGYPMVDRIVSIAGELANKPCNVRVRFGTSIAEVLEQTDNTIDTDIGQVRLGGPMSGIVISDLFVGVSATSNCITLERKNDSKATEPCIRCGACSDVCPVGLLPQQLYSFSIADNIDKSETFNIASCIECGCCDAVCPSDIALTQAFRFSKGLIKDKARRDKLAEEAVLRFEQREIRLAERARRRAIKRAAAREKLETTQDPIAAALARSKRRRRNPKSSSDDSATGSTESDGS